MATTKAELTKQIEAFIERVATDIQATGRRQQAYRAFETATVGMRGPRVQLEDIARRASGSATEGAVSSYAEQMVTALKNLENVAGIKPTEFQNAASAIISDVMSFVRSNPLLTDAEKQEIEQFAAELQQYAAKRSAFSTRTKGAVRGLTTKMRGSLADAFLASNDIVSRGIGRLLQGRSVGREERQREIASIREGTTYDASALSGDVMGDTARRESLISRFTTPRSATGQFQKLAVGESKFLDYQAAILQELQLIRKGDEERDEQAELAAELGQTVYQGAPRTVSGVGQARGASKTKGTWFDTIANLMGSNGLGGLLSLIKTVSGAFGTMRGIVSSVLPNLSTLGTGAAIAGAALAGWEIGKWIDEKTGASKKMSEGIAWGMGKMGLGGFEDQDKRMSEQEERNKRASAAARAAMAVKKQNATTPLSTSTGLVQGETFAEGAFADAAPLESLGGGRALPSVPTVTSTTLGTKPMSAPSPTRVDSGVAIDAIMQAASITGMDSEQLIKIAQIESSLNPNAQAKGSSAKGLFQFTDGTWKDVTQKYKTEYPMLDGANVFDPYANALAGALFVRDNQKRMGSTDLGLTYLAHFAGAGGAKKMVGANMSASAASVLGEKAAAANRSIFYTKEGRERSVGEVRALLTTRVSGSRSATPVSAGTTQLAAAQTAAPVVMMVNASRGSAVAPPQPMPVPLPVRPRDPSMEPLSRV